jgi:hypothetical protein
LTKYWEIIKKSLFIAEVIAILLLQRVPNGSLFIHNPSSFIITDMGYKGRASLCQAGA